MKSTVRVNSHLSELFIISQGRQGGVSSPLLYILFIDTLLKKINESDKGIKLKIGNISILLFCDDIRWVSLKTLMTFKILYDS